MFDWQIPLFPFDSSSVTITTTVWIGVLITAFFNLRLGWTLSALVIPGYIVPLMMARPITAAVIMAESAITYGIAVWISEANRNSPYWSSLFGRDRFFLIVIVSVLVRSICDGWLLPAGGQWLVEELNFDLDYRNDLNSFGLIAVALIANYFWKPGIKAGLPCLLTSIGLTWAIVTWLLVPFTNFNIGSFHLLYEDISASMLASPKAYMIILVTGWLASWVNLRYAWDFNGILIPALVALLWTSPERILISFVEAGIILLLGKLILTTSVFKNLAIQGGRKLAFFFTVCFLFRMLLAHGFSMFAPELKVTDYFGLGYLLSTLIAIKIYDKKIPVRVAKGVLQVSVVGAVLASLIGFTLDRMELFGVRKDRTPIASIGSATVGATDKSVAELFKQEKIRLFRDNRDSGFDGLSDKEQIAFRSALLQLKQVSGDLSNSRNRELLRASAQTLAAVNYELSVVNDDEILVRELEPFKARGWFLISPNNNGVSIVAGNAIEEQMCGESAIYLHGQLRANSVAILNTASHQRNGRPVSRKTFTFASVFKEVYSKDNGLYVRAQLPQLKEHAGGSTFSVDGAVPETIDLPKLKELAGSFTFDWRPQSPASNIESDEVLSSNKAAATLWLSDQSRHQMAGRIVLDTASGIDGASDNLFSKCALTNWLSTIHERIHRAGSDQYVSPKEEELLFLDNSILQPIVELAKDNFDNSNLSRIKAIDDDARSIGYRIQVIEDENSGDHFIALLERQDSIQQKGWGTFLLRIGLDQPWGVEIPRPNFELRSYEFGTSIFQRPGASSLFIAGAHPKANVDGSSDVTKTANRGNLLSLARHVLFRELKTQNWLTVQARSIRSPVNSDIVIATVDGTAGKDSLSPIARQLCDSFLSDGLSIEFVDGRAEVAGYELGVMLRAASSQVSENKELMSLWVSPGLRSKFRMQDPNDNLNAQLRACGLESVFTTRHQFVTATGNGGIEEIPESLREQLLLFSDDHDVVKLYSTVQQFENFRFVRFFDEQSQTTLVAVLTQAGKFVGLLNPRGLNNSYPKIRQLSLKNLNDFILSRAKFLEVQP